MIRKGKDSSYKTFAIPLSEYFQCLLNPIKFEENPLQAAITTASRGNTKYRDAQISFIQVTRNYLRFSGKDFYNQDFLRDLYQSGTAFFANSGAAKIDLVASVKLTTIKNQETYVPLFVGLSMTTNKQGKIDKLSNNQGFFFPKKGGIRLEILFDRSKRGFTHLPEILEADDVNRVLDGKQLAKVVFLPKDDPFGITNILRDTIWCGSEISEVYSSHFRLYNHPFSDIPTSKIARKLSKAATLAYLNDMRKALLDARESE